MDLFDPAVFVILPGTDGAATTRATLRPCQCGESTFEITKEPSGRISCQCPRCCKRKGVVVGAISTLTGKGRAVRQDRDET
jgi:hypothetical protein